MKIGIRNLKAQLSEHIQLAKEGQTIIVTDRGKPVARIERYEETGLELGEEQGWVQPPLRSLGPPPQRYTASKTTTEILTEDRQ